MDIKYMIEKQRNFYNTNVTKNVKYRIDSLKRLKKVIIEKQAEISYALKQDLNKSEYESYICEIGMVLNEITCALKNIKKWARIKKSKTSIFQFPCKSFIIPESFGTTLIIAPWNYPFLLCFQPLVSAIAAGNCAIIKPSELSQNTAKIVKRIINEAFDTSYVDVVLGGVNESEELLNQRFDYIFYTGSSDVGKIVMQKASQNLTPITLELGGKCPCIVDETANIEMAAKRIVFGKLLNAGQTCVAPDYILVNVKIKEKLTQTIKYYIELFLGETPLDNEDYPKIVNITNFNRLKDLIIKENIIFGGNIDQKNLKIEPTLLENIDVDSDIMKEEIFGPILPVLVFENMDEAIDIVKQKEKPLALYLFTNNKSIQEKVLKELSFGGGCINDTIMQVSSTDLGFGGVGYSGFGKYHGKHGFDSFTHYKGIIKNNNFIDLPFRYHKYTNRKLKLIKKILK